MTPGRIEALLNSKADDLFPRSINHLRDVVHRVFARAIKRGLWSGPNPAAAVELVAFPRRSPSTSSSTRCPRCSGGSNLMPPDVRLCRLDRDAEGRTVRPAE